MSESQASHAKGVHLVGSYPCSSAEDAMRTIAGILPNHLRSITDGEHGVRQKWITSQAAFFKDVPQVLRFGGPKAPEGQLPHQNAGPNDIKGLLDDMQVGYDEWAIESFQTFKKLKAEGVVAPHVKFQVGMPTPLNVCAFLIKEDYSAAVEQPYEAALLRALRKIQDNIPHDQLILQLELPIELFFLERGWQRPNAYRMGADSAPWFAPPPNDGEDVVRTKVFERLTRLFGGDQIAPDVEMGMHLCYGDYFNKHFIEPTDTKHVADVAAHVISSCGRKVSYVHFPVPKDRKDTAYLEPLVPVLPLLKEHGTHLYVGLVHADDEEGTKERLATATKVLGPSNVSWGVAGECGLVRTPNAKSSLEISRAVAAPLT